ncbi:two-component regulator propeller domain-containing protein [Maribacter sp. SA7]|uniref:ligand-binding sensor domain-containing protein n=1 Tax=Maribacter zhoushanensis TaxID=3030012 RepID=UPI0023EB5C84|nr:sensor histidine kinase [Maribacter zhoushanensis]MDF4203717.1 two-component regulator propeller domain-containing protein [Maribacter zhoushanensis]
MLIKSPLIRKSLLSVLFILTILKLNAQSNNQFLERIGIENGLSSNYPTSILQDSTGYIWIGTNNGLNRYDGYESKVFNYDPNDKNSISDNWITCLLEDSNGNIWIGTEGGGLNLYNTKTGNITRFEYNYNEPTSISSNDVLKIYEDSQQRLWVGTKSGLNLFNENSLSFQRYMQPNECQNCKHSIKTIIEDQKGNLFIGDEFQGLYYFLPSDGTFKKVKPNYVSEEEHPSEFINDLYLTNHKLWVATDNGLATLNTLTNTYKKTKLITTHGNSISDVYIWKIYNEHQGSFWLCTNGSGLVNYDLATEELKVYRSDGNTAYNIDNNSIEDVLVDKSENIWMATTGNGLNKFNLKNLIFNHWEKDDNYNNSLVNNNVRAMFQDLDGTIWIGTNNGLSRFNSKRRLFKNYTKDFNYRGDTNTPKIRTIYRSKNNVLWVGTQGGGLYSYNAKTDRFNLALDFVSNPLTTKIRHIKSIYELGNDSLLIGTTGSGLLIYNTTTSEITAVRTTNDPNNILSDLSANCMLRASDSEVWIGSDRGLVLLNTNTFEFSLWNYKENCKNCIVGNKIRSLFLDDSKQLWIGTRSGLAIFNPKTEEFEQYKVEDGLPSDIIFGILSGADDNIWLTTPNGLSKTEQGKIHFCNISIPGNSILDMGGHSQGTDENLLVGGTSGFTIFNPNDIKDNLHVPNVVLTDIKVNNKSMQFYENIDQIKTIDLPYDQNNLTFKFSALEFTNSKINKYKYKLEGFNTDWIDYGTKHDLTFTNLDPNTYKLKIKGSNNENVWNENETSLTIQISSPWWKTWWFRMLSLLLIIGILFSIYYIRLNTLKKTKKILQKEVAVQTKELVENNKKLKDLHREKDGIIGVIAHDLRSPLNSIDGLIHLLKDDENLDEKQRTYIDYINKSIKSGNSLITDLLLMSNINHPEKTIELNKFNLSIFIEEWEKSYLSRLEDKNQKLRKKIENKPILIYSDQKLLTRIFDNLMTNAMKFSDRGSTIDLNVALNKESVLIFFKDYGPGMSNDDKKKAFKMFQKLSAKPTDGETSNGLGLAIIKTLVEKLNGTIQIESVLEQGTTFIIHLPVINNTN